MDLAFEVRLFEVHHPWPKSCFSQQKNAFERSLSSKKEHYLQCGLSNIIHDEVEMLHRGRQMKAVGLPNYSRGYQKLTIGRRLRHKCLLISQAIVFFWKHQILDNIKTCVRLLSNNKGKSKVGVGSASDRLNDSLATSIS